MICLVSLRQSSFRHALVCTKDLCNLSYYITSLLIVIPSLCVSRGLKKGALHAVDGGKGLAQGPSLLHVSRQRERVLVRAKDHTYILRRRSPLYLCHLFTQRVSSLPHAWCLVFFVCYVYVGVSKNQSPCFVCGRSVKIIILLHHPFASQPTPSSLPSLPCSCLRQKRHALQLLRLGMF